jgi:hypothetical protein
VLTTTLLLLVVHCGFQVPLRPAEHDSAAAWSARFPDFSGWLQLRLQSLQQSPGEWPPSLLSKVLKNRQLHRA